MKRGKLPIIITVCVLVIAAIIISCIEFPSSIKADTDVTELSVTRGKDGKKQEIADSSRIISLLDGMKVKKYFLVSKIKGDTLKSGWEYRLSYKAADGSSNSITISHGEVEYKGKKYKTSDTALQDIIDEFESIYDRYDSEAVSFKLGDIKSITVRDNGTGIKTVIDGDMLNSCIKQLSDDKMNETSEPDNKPVLYEVTFNYNDGTSENVVVYYGDVLSYKSKYYEEGRNLAEVISGNIK